MATIIDTVGYWGGGEGGKKTLKTSSRNIVIAHFHTAKPGRCLECFLTFRNHLEMCGGGECEIYAPFFRSALKADNAKFYEKMLLSYQNYSK